MILQINSDLRLSTDSMNITVEKRRIKEKTGDEYWTSQAYFSNLPSAARWIMNQHIRDFHGSDIEKLCHELDKLYERIEQGLKTAVLV